jgi:hypothetical protein
MQYGPGSQEDRDGDDGFLHGDSPQHGGGRVLDQPRQREQAASEACVPARADQAPCALETLADDLGRDIEKLRHLARGEALEVQRDDVPVAVWQPRDAVTQPCDLLRADRGAGHVGRRGRWNA